MKRATLEPERLAEIVERFSSRRIAVVGDFFLDKYLDVDPTLAEVSVETGKTAHQVVGIRCSPGAAGTVVGNLAALGAGTLHAVGFTGDDGEGYELRRALEELGCSTTHLATVPARHTPTYLKPRDSGVGTLEAEHSRYDTKNRAKTTEEMEARWLASLDALLPGLDAVVIQDQVEELGCGVITRRLRDGLAERARGFPRTVFWADSRRRIREFQGVLIKPNQFEAVGEENPSPVSEVDVAELRSAAEALRVRVGAPVVVTLGPRGMIVTDPEWTLVPGVRVEGDIDPTGAGDSATAGAVLALCAGADLPEAALVGNLVASITVQQIGTTGAARPEELASRLALWREQQERAE